MSPVPAGPGRAARALAFSPRGLPEASPPLRLPCLSNIDLHDHPWVAGQPSAATPRPSSLPGKGGLGVGPLIRPALSLANKRISNQARTRRARRPARRDRDGWWSGSGTTRKAPAHPTPPAAARSADGVSRIARRVKASEACQAWPCARPHAAGTATRGVHLEEKDFCPFQPARRHEHRNYVDAPALGALLPAGMSPPPPFSIGRLGPFMPCTLHTASRCNAGLLCPNERDGGFLDLFQTCA